MQSHMKIASSAFQDNAKIPLEYSCQGKGINPPLSYIDVPTEAKSLVLIVDDPDAPSGTFVHWILYNMYPKIREIKENSVPLASLGRTSSNKEEYVPMCPPSGVHRYFFKLYALDAILALNNPDKAQVEEKMQGHIIDKAELMGFYGSK